MALAFTFFWVLGSVILIFSRAMSSGFILGLIMNLSGTAGLITIKIMEFISENYIQF